MKYVIGIDYGTLSARAIIVDAETGKELAEAVSVYSHAVMDETLPDGTVLEKNSAFQHPQDYLDALSFTVSEVLKKSGVSSEDVVGVGIDFTSCTMLPIDEKGTPLCFYDKFKSEPHAYVKLWKHHSAKPEADEITRLAKENGEKWLDIYGGKVSSEWLFPKMCETINKAPEVFDTAHRFIEAGDWLTMVLTGSDVLSSCMAGYKGMWNKTNGYPSESFLEKISPKLRGVIGTKIGTNVKPTGTKAGEINEAGARLTGLKEGTRVAVPIIDAHAALPAAGIADGGKLMLIIGTSTCHILMDEKERNVKGICGLVKDGIIPGFYAYEAGQAAVGDIFEWYVKNNAPHKYVVEAQEKGKDIYTCLTEKAEKREIGESGLVALDWWNGNRTPFADYDLKGAIFGFTLNTKPEEIFRALLESTAFGTKAIVDLYEENEIEIDEVYATGGISQKNKFMMQMYADVLNKPVIVPDIKQAGAMGSAVFASYAGGVYDDVKDAVKAMVHLDKTTYMPNGENHKKYMELYKKYKELVKLFGIEKSYLMRSNPDCN